MPKRMCIKISLHISPLTRKFRLNFSSTWRRFLHSLLTTRASMVLCHGSAMWPISQFVAFIHGHLFGPGTKLKKIGRGQNSKIGRKWTLYKKASKIQIVDFNQNSKLCANQEDDPPGVMLGVGAASGDKEERRPRSIPLHVSIVAKSSAHAFFIVTTCILKWINYFPVSNDWFVVCLLFLVTKCGAVQWINWNNS